MNQGTLDEVLWGRPFSSSGADSSLTVPDPTPYQAGQDEGYEQVDLVQTELELSGSSGGSEAELREVSEAEGCTGGMSDLDMARGSEEEAEADGSVMDCEESEVSSLPTSESLSTNSAGSSRRSIKKPTFNKKWRMNYLMSPIGSAMQCIVCSTVLKSLKTSTIKRHIQRHHKESLCYPEHKKSFLIAKFDAEKKKQQNFMVKALTPNQAVALAPYVLAYTITKYKMPFNKCEAMVEFAKCADPQSKVFSRMPSSRQSITTKAVELHEKVLKTELKLCIEDSPFWSLMVDESIDSATQEQMVMYVRYVDVMKKCISTKFLHLEQIRGHPDASNLCSAIMRVIESDCFQLSSQKLVGLATDGASVLVSPRNGVIGLLRRNLANPKLFSQHCCPHRLVLAAKAGQDHIPDDIEQTISETLSYFKDSAVRRSEFEDFLKLADPEHEHCQIVQYHKVRWLSLSDCVNRLCDLLPHLVNFFEREKSNMQNRAAVRRKAEALHIKLSNPEFALFILFLQPQLEVLAKINKQLQKSGQTMYITYGKIDAFFRSFVQPILIDSSGTLASDNLKEVEDAIAAMPGDDFQKHLQQCEDHSLLTLAQLRNAKKAMFSYVHAVGLAIEKRYSEKEFVLKHCAFLEVSRRKFQPCDIGVVVDKFSNSQVNRRMCIQQYAAFVNDSTLDFVFECTCNKDPAAFFVHLYNECEEYSELAKLALLLFCLSPDTVECERGFSSMNFIKNEFRSRLTSQNMNACMALAQDGRSVESFPYSKLCSK